MVVTSSLLPLFLAIGHAERERESESEPSVCYAVIVVVFVPQSTMMSLSH